MNKWNLKIILKTTYLKASLFKKKKEETEAVSGKMSHTGVYVMRLICNLKKLFLMLIYLFMKTV